MIFASIRKKSEGGYKWRLAIQCYPRQKDKEYTLCLEILTTDYQLYHHKVVILFSKTASSLPYFLHVENIMAQAGSDLGVYPTYFDKYYLIAYGILGETIDLDPNKTHDYHTAFDIQPTKVVYNVDLDMNRKKILNIDLDQSRSNSAATVKTVKDLYPFTKNNVYRASFEEF